MLVINSEDMAILLTITHPPEQEKDGTDKARELSAGESGEDHDDPSRVEDPVSESIPMPMDSDNPAEGRKRRSTGKSLGWGDKKAPPLNYKPWYSVFIW